MTELSNPTLAPPPDAPPDAIWAGDGDGSSAAPISYTRKIVRLTLAHAGARIGLFWVIVIGLLAIFAPLLANSHPFVMRENGHWRSPFLQYLTPADVVLQVMFWAAVVLFFLRRWSVARRAAILAGIVAAAIVVSLLAVHPPEAPVYDIYRTGIKAGSITSAWFAPIRFSPDDHQRDDPDSRLKAPDRSHLMGSTADAADMASNMIYATRTAISIGFVSTGVAVLLGVIMGGLMGYLGGWIDLLGMRLVEIFEAVPTFLLLLAFSAKFQTSPAVALYIMMAIIGVLSSFGYAEFVRAEFLSLRDRDFVQAARAAGIPLRSILFRHMLPNGLAPVIVNASFGIAGAILIESSLSFLGIGLQSESSWGSLLEQALGSGGTFFWWLAVYPGAAIFLTVLAYNLIGESLRDALDPRLNKME